MDFGPVISGWNVESEDPHQICKCMLGVAGIAGRIMKGERNGKEGFYISGATGRSGDINAFGGVDNARPVKGPRGGPEGSLCGQPVIYWQSNDNLL